VFEKRSRITTTNGRSTRITSICGIDVRTMPTTVTAAASVPSSLTSRTSSASRSRSAARPPREMRVKSASSSNATPIPIVVSTSSTVLELDAEPEGRESTVASRSPSRAWTTRTVELATSASADFALVREQHGHGERAVAVRQVHRLKSAAP
jgi:hypothetical protein